MYLQVSLAAYLPNLCLTIRMLIWCWWARLVLAWFNRKAAHDISSQPTTACLQNSALFVWTHSKGKWDSCYLVLDCWLCLKISEIFPILKGSIQEVHIPVEISLFKLGDILCINLQYAVFNIFFHPTKKIWFWQ